MVDIWANVTPLLEDEGPDPLVAIKYSEKCKEHSLCCNTVNTVFSI